ncbi:MAG: hypothetical protein U9N34_01550 [Candidatus Cloacimonadota bacterium]|nr:hypothetical protein [Candidatus Cloacimonadota bacterium]
MDPQRAISEAILKIHTMIDDLHKCNEKQVQVGFNYIILTLNFADQYNLDDKHIMLLYSDYVEKTNQLLKKDN